MRGARGLTEDVLEVGEAGRADDRGGHAGLGERPGDGDLSHADPALLRDLLDATGSLSQNER